MSFCELPAELFFLIMEGVGEDEIGYLDTLKSLSLVNKRLATHACPKILEQLHIRLNHAGTDQASLHDFLSSNPFIPKATIGLHLYTDSFNLLDFPGWVIFPTEEVRKRKHAELFVLVSSRFQSLTHLTITRGPEVDIALVSSITTLQSLELLKVDLKMDHPVIEPRLSGAMNATGTEKVLPRLKHLAILIVGWSDPHLPVIAGLDAHFDLRTLESVALSTGDSHAENNLEHLVPRCGKSLKWLSIHIRDFNFVSLCMWQVLPSLESVQHLYLYFSEGIQIDHDVPGYDIDPYLQEMVTFLPPPALVHLSFGFKWHASMMSIENEWRSFSQIPAMTSVIASLYEERWGQLKTIDFQMMASEDDFKECWDERIFGEVRSGDLTAKGVSVSVFPNRSMANTDWPYYFHISMRDRSVSRVYHVV